LASLFVKYGGFVSLRHTSYSGHGAAPEACNPSRADRTIDSPFPERMNRPFASWSSFTPAGSKMQGLCSERAGEDEKRRTQKAAATDTRECRHSCCTPVRGISRNASRVEIACIEWKARKNNLAVSPMLFENHSETYFPAAKKAVLARLRFAPSSVQFS